LDTRSKIVTAEEACERLAGRPAQWLSGHFDPLLAEHVRRLRECAAPGSLLVVEITNPPRPLLAQRARAELAAALNMVDYVVLANGGASQASSISGESGITGQFVELVLRRNGEPAG
jgi:bifunctional ADP-heptose synthase (sugar kinase/adenylyltransferase)